MPRANYGEPLATYFKTDTNEYNPVLNSSYLENYYKSYVAGYAAHNNNIKMLVKIDCSKCTSIFLDSSDNTIINDDYFENLTRGGLLVSSNNVLS